MKVALVWVASRMKGTAEQPDDIAFGVVLVVTGQLQHSDARQQERCIATWVFDHQSIRDMFWSGEVNKAQNA